MSQRVRNTIKEIKRVWILTQLGRDILVRFHPLKLSNSISFLRVRPQFSIYSSSNVLIYSWWRHQMETFSALLAICAGNSPVPAEFPAQRPVTRSFDVFFDLRLNNRLNKQSWGWWFERLSCPLWRQCNVEYRYVYWYQVCARTHLPNIT